MIQLNPRYEVIFVPENIDLKAASEREQCQDLLVIAESEQVRPKVNCDRIAGMMRDDGDFIKEAQDAGCISKTFLISKYRVWHKILYLRYSDR